MTKLPPYWALAQLCALSYQEVHWVYEDLGARLDYIEGQSVITFRGSANAANWIRDFDVLPEWGRLARAFHRLGVKPHQWKYHRPKFSSLGLVDSGFLHATDQILAVIMNSGLGAKEIAGRPLHVFDQTPLLIGHSLGGAEAVLAAARLLEMNYDVEGVVTFNAPHCGGATLRDIVGYLTTELRHGGDVVSLAPRLFGLYGDVAPPLLYGPWLPAVEAHSISNFLNKDLYHDAA